MDRMAARSAAKVDRILDATRTLLLRRGSRGVTMSEVARIADVGKGTVYLYWETKEELIVELFVRDFLETITEVLAALSEDPETVVARRLLPLMHRTTQCHPFLAAVRSQDNELLGYVEDHRSIRMLMDRLGPGALLAEILPRLRTHHLVRDDLPLQDQIYGAMAILEGFMHLPHGYPFAIDLRGGSVDPECVMAEMARVFFEPPGAFDSAAVAAAAADVRSYVEQAYRRAAEDLIPARRGRAAPAA